MAERGLRHLLIRPVPLLVASIVAACPAPTETTLSGRAQLDPAADGRIVVIPPFPCLGDALTGVVGTSRLMPSESFRDAMFPWFEPGRSPATRPEMDALLAKPPVREKIGELDVRYLIALTSRTDRPGSFPGLLCGGGYGGAGCLGVAWEKKESRIDAIVWDLRESRETGTVSAASSGRSVAVGVILPIVFIAYTEAEACATMADAIASELK